MGHTVGVGIIVAALAAAFVAYLYFKHIERSRSVCRSPRVRVPMGGVLQSATDAMARGDRVRLAISATAAAAVEDLFPCRSRNPSA